MSPLYSDASIGRIRPSDRGHPGSQEYGIDSSDDKTDLVNALFFRLLEAAPADRARLLDEACAGKPSLRSDIESLLAAHASAGGFLEAPALEENLASPSSPGKADAAGHLGRTIGAYRLERVLGAGGMGTVYLAERADAEFEHRVAIKLIRPGLGTEDILQRFRNERQVLARLEHPNIARLIDGGATDDGQPYLVMEYVDGEPIDRHCKNRRLSLRDRLDLFRTVCSAVHYAHQNLIVHRDLKPSNILVDTSGRVKLLDFGVAKMIGTDDGDAGGAEMHDVTLTGQRVLTPRYASPEQVRGEPVSTASDVYSLGVVLFQLLTGELPYRPATTSPRDLERAICEDEPTRPSTAARDADRDAAGLPEEQAVLASRLSGDLDTILLMSLRKEPERRYGSARELADDIRRHEDGFPVLARPDTLRYRAEKFVRRNRVLVGSLVVVFLALAIAVVVSTAAFMRAERERERAEMARANAERRFDQVRRMANVMLFDIHDAIEKLEGATPARKLLIENGLAYLDSLSNDASDDPELLFDLAEGYKRLAALQGIWTIGNLGDFAGALTSYRKAERLLMRRLENDVDPFETRQSLIGIYRGMADVEAKLGHQALAVETYEKQIRIADELGLSRQDSRPSQRLRYVGRMQLGKVLNEMGRPDASLAAYSAASRILDTLRTRDPDFTEFDRDRYIIHDRIGLLRAARGEFPEAVANLRDAHVIVARLMEADPSNAQFRSDLSQVYWSMSEIQRQAGELDSALVYIRGSLAIDEAIFEADPENRLFRSYVSSGHETVGDIHVALGDTLAAARAYGRSFELRRAIGGPDAAFAGRLDLVLVQQKLADLQTRAGRPRDGHDLFVEAVAMGQRLTAEDSTSVRAARALVEGYHGLGRARRDLGDLDGADDALRASHALAVDLIDRWPDATWPFELAMAAGRDLGRLHERRSHETAAGAARAAALVEARRWFDVGRALADSAASRGHASPALTSAGRELAADVSRCDRAIAAAGR